MRTRGWRLAVVGLGTLSLVACAGRRQQPPTPQQQQGSAQLATDMQETVKKLAQCNELRAKVSVQEEYALGAAVAANWVKGGGGLLLSAQAEQELELYLNRVGGNLAAQSSRPTLRWTFGALREARAINASSAPGGYVFVTQGLLKAVENEAQLAGVLAHEVAHVTLRHALTRYDDVKVQQCRVAVGLRSALKSVKQGELGASPAFSEALGKGMLDLDAHHGVLTQLADKLVDRIVTEGYAQRDEYAADEEAVRLLVSAGYEPQEYASFLGKLPDVHDGFAHHPSKVDRQRQVMMLIANAAKDASEFPELPTSTSGLKKPALPPVFGALRAAQ